ncbi:MAG TPA: caspase family protein [Bacteroidia bacterium]|nr:caspase family protein [Bacteroidia bacterium]
MTKILCIHGIGHKDLTIDSWSKDWQQAILKSSGLDEHNVEFDFLKYDDLFDKRSSITHGVQYTEALSILIKSWISAAWDELTSRGLKDNIRWYAGMPAQFAADEVLRKQLRDLLTKKLDDFKPDLVYAHSLGTLLTYDTLAREATENKSRKFVLITSGAQIAHPALLSTFGGKIIPLYVKHWLNLHNENDRVFASRSISVDADNFSETETPFKEGGINHEVLRYMAHENAVAQVWPEVVKLLDQKISGVRAFGERARLVKAAKKAGSVKKIVKQSRKALLVGINDYPDPENQLNGCMNDVFRVSEVLQEIGFQPEEIRVVFNERATSKNVRERMDWLLSDAKEGDTRFFFYSGHGAQIPDAHDNGDTDHKDECLVTYDFDWTPERAYTDKEFLQAYSQLSYGVDFITMLDCCHSGGMTRDAGMRARGLNPPDDIRHRELKWDPKIQMWIPRDLLLSKKRIFERGEKNHALYTGADGDTYRFGRAVPLWSDAKSFEKAKKAYGHSGPYMPLILEACQEKEYSYEYRHGVTSYGAFTYSVTTILRQLQRKKEKVSYAQLMQKTTKLLNDLGYDQHPVVVGAEEKVKGDVPLLNLG